MKIPVRPHRAALLLGLGLLTVGCDEPPPRVAEVRPVRTTTVEPQALADDRRAVGEIKPRHESDLGFRVGGKLLERPAEVGATVKRGDVLARLDTADYRDKLRSAEADVASARASQIEAQASEDRLRQLLAGGHTTRANFDAALRNLRSSEAKLDSARAAFDLARSQVAYATLTAEFDGVVTAVGAEPGQVVDVGRMVVRLAKPGDKDAVFAVAEAQFGRPPANGQKPAVEVTLLSNPSVVVEGTIREIAPVADAATRTYLVKVSLAADAPEPMRFGAAVSGRIKAAGAPVVVLPGSALFDQAGQPAVWVVDPAAGVVALKPVAVQRYEIDRVIVSEGLSRGELVVTAGVNRLRENQKVRVAEGGAQ